jgi:hypothetical protein
MLTLWPNWWDEWELAHKVSFDGPNKIIYIHPNISSIDIKVDVYSAWKEWVTLHEYSAFLPAFTAVGGDPISGIINLGSTYFLENGWRIKPAEANATITISGNIYVREGGSPYVHTDGPYNVNILGTVSNLIDTVSISGSTGPTSEEVATAVWDEAITSHTTLNSAGELVQRIEKKVDDNQALIISK